MKKKRFLKLLLVGGLIVTTTIGLDSCKKNSEATDEDLNVPMTEIEVSGLRDSSMPDMDLGFICPYCEIFIAPGTTEHVHHFSPKVWTDDYGITHYPFLPTPPDPSNPYHYGSLDSLNEDGDVVYDSDGNPFPNHLGNRRYPFPVDYCEIYWNLPPGGHVCPYCVEGRYHRHNITYHISTNGHDGYTHNQWHVGGGAEP